MIGERTQRHGSRGNDGHRGSMSDMTLVLHEMISVLHQSVAINAKGVDFLLRLVVIDVNSLRKFGNEFQ